MIRVIAYLDPGTGATLTQLLLAGTVGIGVVVKLKWNSVRSFFDRSTTDASEFAENAENASAASEDDGPIH